MKKISITLKQAHQYNMMLAMLKTIAKDYQTPDEIRTGSEKQYGLDYDEALGYAYENIQSDAGRTVKGVRALKIPINATGSDTGK